MSKPIIQRLVRATANWLYSATQLSSVPENLYLKHLFKCRSIQTDDESAQPTSEIAIIWRIWVSALAEELLAIGIFLSIFLSRTDGKAFSAPTEALMLVIADGTTEEIIQQFLCSFGIEFILLLTVWVACLWSIYGVLRGIVSALEEIAELKRMTLLSIRQDPNCPEGAKAWYDLESQKESKDTKKQETTDNEVKS